MRKLNPRRKKPCTGDPRLHDAQIDDDAMDRTRMEPTADGRQGDKEVKEEGDAIEMVPRKDSSVTPQNGRECMMSRERPVCGKISYHSPGWYEVEKHLLGPRGLG